MHRFSIPFACSIALTSASIGAEPPPLTLERIFSEGEFHAQGYGPARWLADGSGYTTLERSGDGRGVDIVRYDPASGSREVLVAAEKLKPEGADGPLGIDDYAWSDDGRTLLIFANTRRVWRSNTRGDYWAFDRRSGRLRKLGGDAPESSLMFAKFSPDGRRIAYVRDNNIHVESLEDGKIIPLTADGSSTRINGTFDWVYEEELSLRDGFRWSPDGKSVAYWQVDTTGVRDYILVNTVDDLYPKLTRFPYPKVGQVNPSSRVGVVAATGGETRWVELPGDPREHYIARMDWADNPDQIALQRLNRLQNHDQVILADAKTGRARVVLDEHDETWVDVVDDVKWFEQGRKFTWISERDGWRHLYLGSADGRLMLATPGAFDVVDVVRVDPKANEVDFIASPDDPKARYLFRGSVDGSAPPKRLTPPELRGTHSYQVVPDGKWAIHTWSNVDTPPVIDLVHLPDHKVARTLVDNAGLRARIAGLRPVERQFFRVKVEDGTELDGWEIRPPLFDPFDASKRYPLLIHVYGEPYSQTVLDRWDGNFDMWHRMLAERGFVVMSVDNRGTSAPRGRAWRKSVYRQVGILASRDQAEALRALERRWPYVDPRRVGIWGWSGGGSMTLNAIFRYPDLYSTGVAVAFISDQKLYDTIYQERYMALPATNPDGYRDGSPITFAENLKGNLLLVHGTGDDNCHYQSCERLVDRLIALNKPFSMLAYPNRTHSIGEGPNTTRHLFESMTRFLETSLKPEGARGWAR